MGEQIDGELGRDVGDADRRIGEPGRTMGEPGRADGDAWGTTLAWADVFF